jgi:hypothetical protein
VRPGLAYLGRQPSSPGMTIKLGSPVASVGRRGRRATRFSLGTPDPIPVAPIGHHPQPCGPFPAVRDHSIDPTDAAARHPRTGHHASASCRPRAGRSPRSTPLVATMATVSSQTTPNGYRDTPAFMVSFGGLTVVGVEGNDSYGDGCAHAARRRDRRPRSPSPDRAPRSMSGNVGDALREHLDERPWGASVDGEGSFPAVDRGVDPRCARLHRRRPTPVSRTVPRVFDIATSSPPFTTDAHLVGPSNTRCNPVSSAVARCSSRRSLGVLAGHRRDEPVAASIEG